MLGWSYEGHVGNRDADAPEQSRSAGEKPNSTGAPSPNDRTGSKDIILSRRFSVLFAHGNEPLPGSLQRLVYEPASVATACTHSELEPLNSVIHLSPRSIWPLSVLEYFVPVSLER